MARLRSARSPWRYVFQQVRMAGRVNPRHGDVPVPRGPSGATSDQPRFRRIAYTRSNADATRVGGLGFAFRPRAHVSDVVVHDILPDVAGQDHRGHSFTGAPVNNPFMYTSHARSSVWDGPWRVAGRTSLGRRVFRLLCSEKFAAQRQGPKRRHHGHGMHSPGARD